MYNTLLGVKNHMAQVLIHDTYDMYMYVNYKNLGKIIKYKTPKT